MAIQLEKYNYTPERMTGSYAKKGALIGGGVGAVAGIIPMLFMYKKIINSNPRAKDLSDKEKTKLAVKLVALSGVAGATGGAVIGGTIGAIKGYNTLSPTAMSKKEYDKEFLARVNKQIDKEISGRKLIADTEGRHIKGIHPDIDHLANVLETDPERVVARRELKILEQTPRDELIEKYSGYNGYKDQAKLNTMESVGHYKRAEVPRYGNPTEDEIPEFMRRTGKSGGVYSTDQVENIRTKRTRHRIS